MTRVLFVCHGNICRSPMCEIFMKDLVSKNGMSDKFEIASAATSTEEIWNGVGNPVYPPAREELARHGLSAKGKRARQTTASDYLHYDYIVGMDNANYRNMMRIYGGDPEGKVSLLLAHTSRPGSVADPWYTGDFGATWRDVEEGCTALYNEIVAENDL